MHSTTARLTVEAVLGGEAKGTTPAISVSYSSSGAYLFHNLSRQGRSIIETSLTHPGILDVSPNSNINAC